MALAHDDLLDAISGVFRSHGFEGASLSLLSKATGLGRASLYHRFPGGKEEMALAVLGSIDERFAGAVLQPLGETGPIGRRVRRTAERLGEFYEEGGAWCLMETLSLGEPTAAVRSAIAGSISGWVDAFTAAAREGGAGPKAARRLAESAVASIQGALILARATGDRAPFEAALAGLPESLSA